MPVWLLTIKLDHIWRSEDPFLSKRDTIVKVIKDSRWRELTGDSFEYDMAIEELSEALNPTEFDLALCDIYDLADEDRVWIETR